MGLSRELPAPPEVPRSIKSDTKDPGVKRRGPWPDTCKHPCQTSLATASGAI
jgi:hypothetical protein